MAEINLTQGKTALIDDEDFESLSKFKWHAYKNRNKWYAKRALPKNGKHDKQHGVKMHRVILNVSDSKTQVDHINGNGLDNRKENLRPATIAQNTQNRDRTVKNKSGYKGVRQRGKKWTATIAWNGKQYYIGTFKTKEEAAKAYDTAALKIFGEFARLNFPDKQKGAI